MGIFVSACGAYSIPNQPAKTTENHHPKWRYHSQVSDAVPPSLIRFFRDCCQAGYDTLLLVEALGLNVRIELKAASWLRRATVNSSANSAVGGRCQERL
ncbi:MAG: hypothetical protein IPN64_03535 [Propionivibrio sp.]|uniref:hypothetical protein n=1 Tax=Propionivibrio sp. TaxID=2212460 RepID=UPI0025F336C4|nr:hypothetical protein [Propionivibrio sp.]MBK8893142.1 hypothetical protein [Propionivibrio sp.]